MSKGGWRNSTDAVESDAKPGLASALLEQIKISCYTEYKMYGPFTNLQYMLKKFFNYECKCCSSNVGEMYFLIACSTNTIPCTKK